jgi:GNAT superfamily N-acetyltransferase
MTTTTAETETRLEIKLDCSDVDWAAVSETLKAVGMGYHAPEVHRRAFEASHTTVFVYLADRLIGFGRALSDGEYQAAVYDCAVVPDHQGKGVGATVMKRILERISHCNVILYATPGKEGFYETTGFRKMKSGMALFTNSAAMTARGFTE